MKKPTFIIAETLLSMVLIASLAAVAVLAIDINTDGSIIPPEIYGGKSRIQKDTASLTEDSAPPKPSDPVKEETSKAPETPKASPESDLNKTLILQEPAGLNSQPEDLTRYISQYGFDYEGLSFNRCIVVDSDDKSKANVYCYQKGDNGYWWNIAGKNKFITDKAFVGEKGPDYNITPGSKKSPLGFYMLGQGFYIGQKPVSTYPMFEITDSTYWVDDPKSAFYNTKVDGTDKKDWNSANHMITQTEAYKYGLVVNYNTNNISSELASSIFMYCGNAPTEGGIALPENVMLAILNWLDEDSLAYIYIV